MGSELERKEKPVIALTCMEVGDKNKINRAYIKVIEKYGGIPLLIPSLEKMELAGVLLERISGLMLTGGVDVDPYYFGEEPLPGQRNIEPYRDKLEISLVERALKHNMPILGICRGMQVLNIGAGGDIYQDIHSQLETTLKHEQKAPGYYPTHSLETNPGTILHEITGSNSFRVNSFHHQAVRRLARGFVASGFASDGLVEAIESEEHDFVLAFQYHPELMCPGHRESEEIFRAFVSACFKYFS